MNNENMINKPITMVTKEVKDILTKIINEAQLPACIIELILSNLLIEVRTFADKQYQSDKEQYEIYLKNYEKTLNQNESKNNKLNSKDKKEETDEVKKDTV